MTVKEASSALIPRIAFRVDASLEIGTGHVMRCLTLATALRERQRAACHFLCREHHGHLIDMIESRGFTVYRLKMSDMTQESTSGPDQEPPFHAHWLGTNWQTDAQESAIYLEKLNPDWLVVDHYALEAQWERVACPARSRLLVIDDLADRCHSADILLDQNVLDHQSEDLYRKLVNPECRLLLGPRYALLKKEYAVLAEALPERDGQISRVLVFVGGSDPFHLTERYLEALAAPEFEHLFIDVVLGKNHPKPSVVERFVKDRHGARLYSGLTSLAALMVRADLMLGAGGTTNWERMCLGLTSIVVSVAHNQDEINQKLSSQKLISFLGGVNSVSVKCIRTAIRCSLDDAYTNSKNSKRARNIVSGKGADFVIQYLARGEIYAFT
ncbi:UDP-2,4-diacetamido-2,4,6-trideoxy-beta-L-altropyranose hydrolase [Salinicola halimionae]|uniref:UDP-2,4-diacetamido-2,4, 6-trideoxy-beta-L-altropyranose hydrolase n=1 Tax=Salinicola halimionae TaxID=1949081 RepID=UPI000DA12F39|nr:UDP-2,4-diacetamido-2,4,6-trideoxy-beta-L-altropyranose hydrolase [Salinicola halimionae]